MILSRIYDRRRRRRFAPSLTRSSTRTECRPSDQGRFLSHLTSILSQPAQAALLPRDHRQDQARRMRAVVMQRVGPHQRWMIRMREHAVGRWRVAIGELEADAVALFEYIRDRQHFDVERVD